MCLRGALPPPFVRIVDIPPELWVNFILIPIKFLSKHLLRIYGAVPLIFKTSKIMVRDWPSRAYEDLLLFLNEWHSTINSRRNDKLICL